MNGIREDILDALTAQEALVIPLEALPPFLALVSSMQEHATAAVRTKALLDDITPQLAKLTLQDYQNLNELAMLIRKLVP